LLPLMMPLGGVGLMVWIAKFLKVEGDIVVYPVLLGLLMGAVGADLSVGNASGGTTATVPFAMIVVAGILLFLWWWNS
jgi:hypothetical protein